MKDAFYFPHDSNARHDPRIVALCSKFGLVAYACYFQAIEMLREQKNYQLDESLWLAIATPWHSYNNAVSPAMASSILDEMFKLNLLQKKDGKIHSQSLIDRMKRFDDIRRKRSEAGSKGAAKVWQRHGDPMAVKESKVKKEKTTTKTCAFAPPSLNDLKAYCLERSNKVDPQQFLDHYTANGWRVGRNPMKDWRAAVRTWERNHRESAAPEPKQKVIG